MASGTDRRERISDAVLDIVDADGIRALTHRAVDRHLELPAGSTSYYFRTKRELLVAAAAHLTEISRRDFRSSRLAPPPPDATPPITRIAADIGAALDATLADRARDLRVRCALMLEMMHDKEIQQSLSTSIFSRELATDLVRALGSSDPEVDGGNFVALCEGLVWESSVGMRAITGPAPGTTASRRLLTAAVATYLSGVVARAGEAVR
ncbi:TetR/AcrR family transcriptional regulator [Rhodococcus sp. NPDC127528]|uniref:TetR/AcrR family transcriptional regulator n=1 Tax=unclassified Rhodococcus (in: high G+C Gram-positive bacteria) TaxID=192944 RepID=UPI0036284A53